MIAKIIRKVIHTLYRASMLGSTTGPHVTRYFMYKHLRRYAEPRAQEAKLLSISHSENLAKLLGFEPHHMTHVAYPEVNMLDLPFPDQSFDAVVSDQVLEHIEGDPQVAIDEVFRILQPGGICLHTTCFINPIHGYPHDYWRFTAEALKLLSNGRGAIIDIGGWGNPYVWLFTSIGLRYQPIPDARWHPAHWIATKQVVEWPIVTWLLAKKPQD